MVPIDTRGRLVALVDDFFAPFFDESAIPLTTQDRANASSSRVTVSGIITSTIGLPPLAAHSAAASMSACTCMAYKPGLRHPDALRAFRASG